jgi:FAD/FMN-containing dehydrogenase
MRDDTLYINFGFWDGVRSRQTYPRGHFNRLIEEEVTKLGGIKSLYSESFYSRETFDQQFGGDHYRALKARYDPDNRLKDLYQKCVLRQ